MGLAEAAAARSEDPYRQVGAVILRPDNSVASVGYNGAPPGVALNWASRDAYRLFVIHAEVNALRYCTRSEVRAGLLASTTIPCPSCLTSIAAHGIDTVVFGSYRRTTESNQASINAADVLGINISRLPKRTQP